MKVEAAIYNGDASRASRLPCRSILGPGGLAGRVEMIGRAGGQPGRAARSGTSRTGATCARTIPWPLRSPMPCFPRNQPVDRAPLAVGRGGLALVLRVLQLRRSPGGDAVFPLIREEFVLSSTQLGLLGSAFMIVYAVGCAVRRLSWSIGRRDDNLIVAGLAFWSLICAATGARARSGSCSFPRGGGARRNRSTFRPRCRCWRITTVPGLASRGP